MYRKPEFTIFLTICLIAIVGIFMSYTTAISGKMVVNYREGLPPPPKYQYTIATEHCNVFQADLSVNEEECLLKGLAKCEMFNAQPGRIATCLKECNRDMIRQCMKALGTKGISVAPPMYKAGVRYQPR